VVGPVLPERERLALACLTVANLQVSAFVNGNGKVQYSFPSPRTTGNGAGSYIWTPRVL
jgi:hypothetical protein